MSDLLDRVAGPGLDLLGRVDAVLATAGAPAGDPVWPLLRQLGALPGDVLTHLLEAVPAPLEEAAADIRADATALGRAVDAVPGVAGWSGHAADAYAGQWSAATSHLDRIIERLAASAQYATAVADWVTSTRRQVAMAVAECLASREAATVRFAGSGSPDAQTGQAAAAIATHVLAAVAGAVEAGDSLREQWAGRLDEVRYRPAAPVASGGTPTVIEL